MNVLQNLIEDLKGELGGHFEEVIVALCLPPDVYLCQQLNKAMEGAGTDESTLIEIICSKTNDEIKSLVTTYESCKYFGGYIKVLHKHCKEYKTKTH